ncbi:MAG TPA: AsmA-like C-terminal region-containing protein [Gammaproteobacteria bacterium]|nr:AsmA-like C-terminal region-containing protein [Gammaproteobacteria bacterium]
MHVSKPIVRRIIIFLGTLLVSLLLVVAFMQVVLFKVNQNRDAMVTKLKQEFGFPLTFNSIEAHWFGLSLGVALKNVVVLDPTTPIAFASIENIVLFPDISSLLFQDEPRLKKVALQDLKLVIGWDDKKDVSILGLQGEGFPTGIDYKAFIALLSKLQVLVVDGALIEWRGPNLQIKQSLRGKFDWVEAKTTDWQFVGTQQLQIREGLKLPESGFNIAASSNLEEVRFKLTGNGLFVVGNLGLSEDKKWQTNCKVEINQLNLAEMHAYYHPTKTDLPLLKWFYEALPRGKITKAQVEIKGPFDALNGFGKIHFKDTDCEYTPGWPKIEKAKGLVTIESEGVLVSVSRATIMGSPIQSMTARIFPIGGVKKPVVIVEGVVESTLEKGLLFLQKSPLQESIAQHLEILNPRGFMHLNLKYEIPLESQPLKVEGSIAVKNGEIDIPDRHLSLKQLNGTFQFSQAALNAANVIAQLGHLPITLNVNTTTIAKQKRLEVTASALLSSVFLQQQFHIPFLQKLEGESLFTLLFNKPLDSFVDLKTVDLKKASPTSLSLTSDLEGMKINLPYFLGKTKNERVPMTLKIDAEIKDERKIALQLSERFDVKLKTTGSMDHLSIKSGHIVLGGGKADWTSKPSLFVSGEISKFKVDEWFDCFDEMKVKDQKMFPPLNIHLLIGQLEVYGLRFDKTWVSANFAEIPLKWRLNGSHIKGTFSDSVENKKEKSKQITVNLAYLKIMSRNVSLETKATTQLASFTKVPVHFYCRDLQYDQGNFGEVSFKLIPAIYGYQIQNLFLETPISELSGNGEWHLGKEGVYTTLHGKLKSMDMGETLSRWDFPSAIRESSGVIQYQLQWPKHPFQFKLGLVDGSAELKFDKGRILGVNSGLGRIVSLLNLENIYRRLKLDFSDLVKKGFVFDTLKGNFRFDNGVAKTDKLSIDGPSAKITLSGIANMNTKAVNLEMAVLPHMGTGLPIAAAIAVGNPAVGAGLWIIDKLTGSKINKISRHYYHVTGTWESPRITEGATNGGNSRK